MFVQALGLAAALSNPVPPVDPCPQLLELLDAAPHIEHVATFDHLGANTVTVIGEALASLPDEITTGRLLDFLLTTRDARTAAAIRPFVFSPNPEIATLATRALPIAAGARAIPTLELILSSNRPFEQTLAAIEGLADIHAPTSFPVLAAFAANPARDPILRASAARALPDVDLGETRKWFRKLALPADLTPFLRTRFDLLSSEIDARSARR